jgi:hypothetical protein
LNLRSGAVAGTWQPFLEEFRDGFAKHRWFGMGCDDERKKSAFNELLQALAYKQSVAKEIYESEDWKSLCRFSEEKMESTEFEVFNATCVLESLTKPVTVSIGVNSQMLVAEFMEESLKTASTCDGRFASSGTVVVDGFVLSNKLTMLKACSGKDTNKI